MTQKEVLHQFFEGVYNGKDYSLVFTHFSPTYRDHHLSAVGSAQAAAAVIAGAHEVFPDLSCRIIDLVEEGDRVAVRVSFTGTHSAEIYGIPATGKKITWEALEIFRFEAGVIVESWGYWPGYEMVQRLVGNTP